MLLFRPLHNHIHSARTTKVQEYNVNEMGIGNSTNSEGTEPELGSSYGVNEG